MSTNKYTARGAGLAGAAGLLLLAALSGCGNGNDDGPDGPQLLDPQDYFPSTVGSQYTYSTTTIGSSLSLLDDDDFTFRVEDSPFGAGVYYNTVDQDDQNFARGPLFDGLRLIGMGEGDGGTATQKSRLGPASQALLLPLALGAVGQSWPISFTVGADSEPFVEDFAVTGTATLAAVEDVSVAGETYEDSLRVDIAIDGSSIEESFTASIWLAPFVGPVRGRLSFMGIEVLRADLVNSQLE